MLAAPHRRTSTRLTLLAALTPLIAVGAVACGDDEDARTAESIGSVPPGAARPCVPVDPDRESEADQVVSISLADYAFVPTEITVDAGTVTFEVENIGDEAHELAVLPGGGDVPFVEGAPDEDALAAAGAFELESFDPGLSCNATFELEPGTYTLFCIVHAGDGETHYEKGMRGTLIVV
jgi:plastocyanin